MADVQTPVDEVQGAAKPAADGATAAAPAEMPPTAAAFAGKAKDLGALRDAVVDAANVGAGLWFSYLFVLLYLIVAVGGVTHRNLLFESPVKLPFLGVDLPLVGFFVLGPALFLIVHAYVLLHFAMLADKVGVFHAELQAQIADDNTRARLRRQLPSNIFVQFLAGPIEVRSGLIGTMLRLIAQISLVAGPLALLVFFQLQFLPYHDEAVSWWQRIAVVADLVLLWALWPSVARGETSAIASRDFRRPHVAAVAVASLILILLVFTVATFPGEWLNRNPVSASIIPKFTSGTVRWITPHQFLVAGDVDLVARKPTSLWSNRLVLPGLDKVPEGFSARGKDLEGIVLLGANLQKMDFTAARLQHARLNDADLLGAKFLCGGPNLSGEAGSSTEQDPNLRCADLEGAQFDHAKLQGASFIGAQLRDAWFGFAQLQGAALDGAHLQNVRFDWAQLQNATFVGAELQHANFTAADAQGAKMRRANLDNANLSSARFEGAQFEDAQLRGAWLDNANLRGAMLANANLSGASLAGAELQAAVLDRAVIRGASLARAQLQGASLGAVWLEGASLVDAQLHGASLVRARLDGASLDKAGLQGAVLEGAELRGVTLQGVFVWRADARKAQFEGARVTSETAPKFAGAAFEYTAGVFWCPSFKAPCDWSAESFDLLKRFIAERIPEGDLRRHALERIATLDPAIPLPDQTEMGVAWTHLVQSSPSLADYEQTAAEMWRRTGCGTRDQPFVAHGLLRNIAERFVSGGPGAIAVATALLDPFCEGMQNLSEPEKDQLRALQVSAPPPPQPPPEPTDTKRRHRRR